MEENIKELYKSYSRPLPARLMEILKLDKEYIKAENNYLFYKENGIDVKVMDLIGGYGSLLLGHNNMQLIEYINQLYLQKVPMHSQLSTRAGTALLSKKINDLISQKSKKKYITTLVNTGSEAIEAAIKHSYFSYKNKLDNFMKRIETVLLNINIYYSRHNANFNVTFNNKVFYSIEYFKEEIINVNKSIINKNPPVLLASKKSFHGKTLAALAITFQEKYRNPFLFNSQFENYFFSWEEEEVQNLLNSKLYNVFMPEIKANGKLIIKEVKLNSIVGVIIEPILGEGGVLPVPNSFLSFLREITIEHNIPLIFDEVQCGCFRTGEFLASFKANVFADYYILGKSLGGGLVKISALIIDKEHYIEEFGMIHTSTYAEDDFSSFIALKGLKIAEEKTDTIANTGKDIKERMKGLKRRYKNIITDVRGEGLMLGISFKDFNLSQSYGFQLLSRSGYLGYMISAYLLNKKRIRVTVPLSDNTTIRIHPSVFITKEEINYFIESVEEICEILYYEDLYKLIEFMLKPEFQGLRKIQDYRHGNIIFEEVGTNTDKVGFLAHYIDIETVKETEPSLKILNDNSLLELVHTFLNIAHPVILGRKNVTNKMGDKVSITFAGMPFTSNMVKDAFISAKDTIRYYQDLCNKAIDFLYSEFNILTIGLGQYTSIILKNGKIIQNSKIKITTGNSYTVYNAVQSVLTRIKKLNKNDIKIAIIGAGGNISTSISYFLAKYCSSILLLGNQNGSDSKAIKNANSLLIHVMKHLLKQNSYTCKLEESIFKSRLFQEVKNDLNLLYNSKLWDMLYHELEDNTPVKAISTIENIKDCDVVVVATNQAKPFLKSKYFKKGALIYDISVPSNCTEELLADKNIKVVSGGIVALPKKESMPLKGFPLKKGEAYACISETILMGFEKYNGSLSFGPILPEQVEEIGKIGSRHGFMTV